MYEPRDGKTQSGMPIVDPSDAGRCGPPLKVNSNLRFDRIEPPLTLPHQLHHCI
jgi:hypothetical protein